MDQEKLLEQILEQLQTNGRLLNQIKEFNAPISPNYRRALAQFEQFEWSSIHGKVESFDRSGAARISWGGYSWTRRNGGGKFGKAIWFSRPIGKGEDGSTQYARLITFKDYPKVEPVVTELRGAH